MAPRVCDDLDRQIASLSLDFSVALSAIPTGAGAAGLRLPAPVLPIALDRNEALLGPLYVPGASVCPACVDHWLGINFYDRDRAGEPSTDLVRALLDTLACGAPGCSPTHAHLLRARDGRVTPHGVFPRRDCPRCGGLARASLPLRLHCSPWTGIVNAVELTTDLTAGAYRATATWASPLPVNAARPFLKRQHSYGRGRTPAEAEAGCLGEALERYSLIYRGDERLIRAQLPAIDAIYPNDIQRFSDTQYRERASWNATADEAMQVPEPFDAAVPVDWLEAQPLGRAPRGRFVAAACCLMWYAFRPGEPEFARADTIGCASGPTVDAALTHALLEWVERDAMAIWWENRLPRPGIRPESFDSPELDAVVAGLRAIGRELVLLDCTTDIAIPAFVAVAARLDGSEPLVAGAADPSAARAACRAASEVGQVWYDARQTRTLSPAMAAWLFEATTSTQPYLVPAGLAEAPRETPRPAEPTWRAIVERLEAVGLSAYAVDHSRPDVSLRTVRAVVPGLRHIWNRRAPGRLYDVPVALGWLAEPRGEADLNPIRCML